MLREGTRDEQEKVWWVTGRIGMVPVPPGGRGDGFLHAKGFGGNRCWEGPAEPTGAGQEQKGNGEALGQMGTTAVAVV